MRQSYRAFQVADTGKGDLLLKVEAGVPGPAGMPLPRYRHVTLAVRPPHPTAESEAAATDVQSQQWAYVVFPALAVVLAAGLVGWLLARRALRRFERSGRK